MFRIRRWKQTRFSLENFCLTWHRPLLISQISFLLNDTFLNPLRLHSNQWDQLNHLEKKWHLSWFNKVKHLNNTFFLYYYEKTHTSFHGKHRQWTKCFGIERARVCGPLADIEFFFYKSNVTQANTASNVYIITSYHFKSPWATLYQWKFPWYPSLTFSGNDAI